MFFLSFRSILCRRVAAKLLVSISMIKRFSFFSPTDPRVPSEFRRRVENGQHFSKIIRVFTMYKTKSLPHTWCTYNVQLYKRQVDRRNISFFRILSLSPLSLSFSICRSIYLVLNKHINCLFVNITIIGFCNRFNYIVINVLKLYF